MSFIVNKNLYNLNKTEDINFKNKEDKIRTSKIKELNGVIITEKLPIDVKISTMTITCIVKGVIFNLLNIAKYIDLSLDGIIAVSHGFIKNPETNRTIMKLKKSKKTKKITQKAFQNQMSMVVLIKGKLKPINIKLFRNGSIQMTGCINIENLFEVIDLVFEKLKCQKSVVRYMKKKIIDKPFVNDISKLTLENLDKIKIQMINSNFSILFKIDRTKLYQLFLEKNMNCLYDPMKHACVNVKYEHKDKSISIFIFEKGSIIITGVKNCQQINDAYNYIYELLLRNYKTIVKNDSVKIENIRRNKF
jgi:TATA-box binding protein (TBP) (component of TFIID and TFIIIB)